MIEVKVWLFFNINLAERIKHNRKKEKSERIMWVYEEKELLANQILNYSKSDYYPFHMPGHKQMKEKLPNWNPFEMDLTEIDGFDNLYSADGILKKAMERTAHVFGAEYSYFLVNGSTGGILSAIDAVTKRRDKVIVARNCHKSVYHAILLKQLKPIYIYPEWIEELEINGGIKPEKLKVLLEENKDCKAIILTSPTYEGIVSNIYEITKIAHSFQIPVIVDEAHGAHFGFAEIFPKSALSQGADIVVQSFHKTLPALTQTGVIHLKSKWVKREDLERTLKIYQTSSPSYLFMANIDYCVAFLEKEQTKWDKYAKKLEELHKQLGELKNIKGIRENMIGDNGVFHVDKSKIILSVCGKDMIGKELYTKLREKYHLQCEMCMISYVLVMTSVLDSEEGYDRLVEATRELDSQIEEEKDNSKRKRMKFLKLEESCSIAEAEEMDREKVKLEKAAGKICADWIMIYPPGIPLSVPGEKISKELIEQIMYYKKIGFEVQGITEGEIVVCQ